MINFFDIINHWNRGMKNWKGKWTTRHPVLTYQFALGMDRIKKWSTSICKMRWVTFISKSRLKVEIIKFIVFNFLRLLFYCPFKEILYCSIITLKIQLIWPIALSTTQLYFCLFSFILEFRVWNFLIHTIFFCKLGFIE